MSDHEPDDIDRWFWCAPCDIEFEDPYAPVREDQGFGRTMFGSCPECGRTVERNLDRERTQEGVTHE